MSTKHYLREEYAYDYEDYEGLLDHLPKFYKPLSGLPLEEQLKKTQLKSKALKAFDYVTPTHVPIEVSFYLNSYVKHVTDNELADATTIGTMHGSV